MSARIGPDLVQAIRAVIEPLDTTERRASYLAGDFPRSDAVKDLDRRYRWDLFWTSGASRLVLDQDPDLRDVHIDTALRAVIAPLAG